MAIHRSQALLHDLLPHRGRLAAIQTKPEGVLVRVRPGTTGIPQHLYGCPIAVEYVDLPSQADVTAAWDEVEAVLTRLQSELPGCLAGWDSGRVDLQPWAVAAAEELHVQ